VTWLALLVLTSAIATTAPADSVPRPISLADAVALAQRNAPAVVQAQGQKRSSVAGVRAAYSAFIPSLSLSAGASRQVPTQPNTERNVGGVKTVTASSPWAYSNGLRASVDLFTGGGRLFSVGQARAQASVAEVNLVAQRYGATLAVEQQFFNVLAARESEAAASAQLDQAKQQLHTSILQLRARTVTRSDSLRSEIAVHNAQLAVTQARIALDQANASLTRAVGASEPVTAAADDSLDRPALAVDDATLRTLAMDGPAVQQASSSLNAARSALRGSWTSYLPTVSASYSRSGYASGLAFGLPDNGYSTAGSVNFSVTFPIFDQFQRQQSVTQAEVARDNAEAALRDAKLAALESLVQSLGTYHAAVEQIALQSATLEAAEEDLREQQLKYQVGTSTLLDVLTSQTTLDQARHDLIQARYNQRVAKAQLEALVGRSL
jgi:outer membrane protein